MEDVNDILNTLYPETTHHLIDDTTGVILFPTNPGVQMKYGVSGKQFAVATKYLKQSCKITFHPNNRDTHLFKIKQCLKAGFNSCFVSIPAIMEELEQGYLLKNENPSQMGNTYRIPCFINGYEMTITLEMETYQITATCNKNEISISKRPIHLFEVRNTLRQVINELLSIIGEPDRLVFPEPYLPKLKEKLDKYEERGMQRIVRFLGSGTVNKIFYMYLFTKYKAKCLALRSDIFIHFDQDNEANIHKCAGEISICIQGKAKILIIPIELMLEQQQQQQQVSRHANILIYREQYNHFEHFEPHGVQYGDGGNTQKIHDTLAALVRRVNHLLGTSFAFIHSSEVCPSTKGFQTIEESSRLLQTKDEQGGYCAAWTMFFTEMCLKNPTRTSNELIQIILMSIPKDKSKNDYLRHLIRGYSQFINEKINKYLNKITAERFDIEQLCDDLEQKKNTKQADELISNLETLFDSPQMLRHYNYLIEADISPSSSGGSRRTHNLQV